MRKNRRFLIGGLIILAALSYVIYGGMQEALVYFVTPSELKAKETSSADKFLRMGGMVVKGSLLKDVKNLTYRFELTDGSAGPIQRRDRSGGRGTDRQGRSVSSFHDYGQTC